VFALHTLAIWFWHAPGPYQAALARPGVHALEHASFLLTACAFWWVVAPPLGRPCAYAPALLLVVGTLAQSGALGAILTLSIAPWYPAHAAGAQVWGVTLLDDQQLAGLLMWVPAGLVYVAAAARLFLRWMADDARRHDTTRTVVRPRPVEGIA
jgi:cytochrome c oxidase assembly factor CtaG